MSFYQSEMLKRNIQLALFIGLSILFFVTSIFNIKAIATAKTPVLIAIDANGTRVIAKNEDPIFTTEAVGFITKFITSLNNFGPNDFMSKVGFATGMMSEELWKSKKASIIDLRSRVEKDEITVESELLKLTKDDKGQYFGLIRLKEKSRLNISEKTIKVEITLKTKPRTPEAPAGLEIDKYEETLVHD